ncbi:transcriptional regulator MexT [Pseudomonas aeruginosa]|nr:transcriptional regulator MexT [Pseudomonas aeruginosa]
MSFAGDLSGFVDEELEKFGRKRKVVLAVPQFNGLGTLLAGTDIIATVPDYAAQALIAAGGLRAEDPPFETRAFELSIGLARRPGQRSGRNAGCARGSACSSATLKSLGVVG